MIYTGRSKPEALSSEYRARDERGLLPEAIRVDPDDVKEKLDPVSRLDFGKVSVSLA